MKIPSDTPNPCPEFITITCLEWKPILVDDRFKKIIVESLSFLVKSKRVSVYAFVIMRNHMHLVWQILGDHARQDVQRDFLKFTSRRILEIMESEKAPLYRELFVYAKDRVRQVWERNSLSIHLWSFKVKWQKINYIHRNPVKARLCKDPEDYHYSSARFYTYGIKEWDFLKHINAG